MRARVAARAPASGPAPAGGDQPALVAIVGRNHSAKNGAHRDGRARAREVRAARRHHRAAARTASRSAATATTCGVTVGRGSASAVACAGEARARLTGPGGEHAPRGHRAPLLGDVDLVVAEGVPARGASPHRTPQRRGGLRGAAPCPERSAAAGHGCRGASRAALRPRRHGRPGAVHRRPPGHAARVLTARRRDPGETSGSRGETSARGRQAALFKGFHFLHI